jgi:hypothetical protein
LPSWKIHRLWSRRLSLSNEISEEVDKVIDLGGEVEGLKVSHDWIKGSRWRFITATWFFYKRFGAEGVKAMMLHGVLDYMTSLLKVNYDDREILWRVIAWVKFTSAKHKISEASHLPKDERLSWVLSQEWNYYDCFDLPSFNAPNLKEVALKAAKELVDFIVRNFNEMLASVKTELL